MVEEERRTRSVLDPIHGLIWLTKSEMGVIDHPLFQRLRHIKQNGLLYYVFPAATHTRFEHSLGVLYVAHGMLNSVIRNSVAGMAKGNVSSVESAEDGESVQFPELNTEERIFIYRVARLAALTHDLGHGPLSHTFDSFAPKRATIAAMFDEAALSSIAPLRDVMLQWGTDPAKNAKHVKNLRVPHEVMSCVFMAKIWHDIGGDPNTALSVCTAILGDKAWSGDTGDRARSPVEHSWTPFVHDVVASAPADADRMDYMERDSRAIGVSYGVFDRNRVLKSLLCYKEGTSNPRFRLGIKRSGLQAIENLMQARYELFTQIYYHKTNRAISLMLESISAAANDEVDLFCDVSTLDDLIKRYLELSDETFFRTLLGRDPSLRVPARVCELANDIKARRFWKRVLDPTTAKDADAVLAALHTQFPLYASKIIKDDTKPKALKDLKAGAALLMRNSRNVYEAIQAGPWTDASMIIQGLAEADNTFVRIYFADSDEAQAGQVREAALRYAFDMMANS